MVAVTVCSDFGAQENKMFYFSCFTFIKRFFSSSSLSAIRVVSSAYLRLLILLPTILISAWASSSLAFHVMYSAYKLNKQGDNIQPWRTPFATLNQSVVPFLVLTVASRPAYRFLRKQVRWSGVSICLRTFHSLLWSIQCAHTVEKVLGSTTDFPTWGSGKGDWESLVNLTLKVSGI